MVGVHYPYLWFTNAAGTERLLSTWPGMVDLVKPHLKDALLGGEADAGASPPGDTTAIPGALAQVWGQHRELMEWNRGAPRKPQKQGLRLGEVIRKGTPGPGNSVYKGTGCVSSSAAQEPRRHLQGSCRRLPGSPMIHGG